MDWLGNAILALAGFVGFDTELLARYGLRFLGGLGVTLQIVVYSMVIGALIALPTALARLSKNPTARAISYAYVYFFRGTPLLAQLFLIYAGLGTSLAG